MIEPDLNIIFDLNGFASTHTINGVPLTVVVGDKITGRSDLDGSWVEMFDVEIKKTDLASPPSIRQKMTYDGASFTVDQVKHDGFTYVVTLSNPRVGEMEYPR